MRQPLALRSRPYAPMRVSLSARDRAPLKRTMYASTNTGRPQRRRAYAHFSRCNTRVRDMADASSGCVTPSLCRLWNSVWGVGRRQWRLVASIMEQYEPARITQIFVLVMISSSVLNLLVTSVTTHHVSMHATGAVADP